MPVKRVDINNYKSIKSLKGFELRSRNILIGANGAGKSNFISFFRLLHNIYTRNLQTFVRQNGQADGLLHFGRKHSKSLGGEICFGTQQSDAPSNSYKFQLIPDNEGGLFFLYGEGGYNSNVIWGLDADMDYMNVDVSGSNESGLEFHGAKRFDYLKEYFSEFRVWHFHDTSSTSDLKSINQIDDNRYLKESGANLAAFLYFLKIKHSKNLKLIEHTIRSIAPYFKSFELEPSRINEEKIRLEWSQFGSENYFNANHLSDGTLRFIALTTLLLQPTPPKIIIIDEPELGLHPQAIIKLGALIKRASNHAQIIISTQSPLLIDQFETDDIVVVDQKDNSSSFRRLNSSELKHWLDEYNSLSDLWTNDIIGGAP